MAKHFLQLSSDKTEIIIFGPKTQRDYLAQHCNSLALHTKDQVKNLGITLDSKLNFEAHIKNIRKKLPFIT